MNDEPYDDEEPVTHNIADATGVRVMHEKCDTCIFHPGNLMHLKRGRVKGMVQHCLDNDAVIPCHKTLGDEQQAVCRGLFDTYAHRIWPLRLAEHMGRIVNYRWPGKASD
jgi:hypothetical protein